MVPKHLPTGNGTRALSIYLRRAVLLLVLGASTSVSGLVSPLGAQERPGAADAYRDAPARALILRAREARDREIEGIQSYEGLLRERVYVGLTAARFRRERGLFERDRIARLPRNANGDLASHWIGARQAIPIVGADTRLDELAAEGRVGEAGAELRDDLRRELPNELLHDEDLPAFAFDPAGDRLAFGDDWALHPLADTAEAHYRFSSGDTLRIHLPPDRDLVLLEIRVEPRRADFHLVAGSLWFEAEAASLVRATYRPARAFNLLLDEPEDAEDVPGFLQPIEAEISYITVEYSLHEFRFWLPRRFALEGEARMGRVVRIPLTVEWQVRDYAVNEAVSSIPTTGPLPPGWSRREARIEDENGKVSYVTVVVPETGQLLASPELSDDFGQRSPTAFTDAEVDELKGELQALLPTYRAFRPTLGWGLSQGLTRYNRVEGLSIGALAAVPVSPATTVELEARMGTGDRELNGAFRIRSGSSDRQWVGSGFRELRPMGDWTTPFSISSSFANLVTGNDRAQYYRVTGASLERSTTGTRVRLGLSGFYERHEAAVATTDFNLMGVFRDDSLRSVLAADPAEVAGARANLRWFSGIDPNGLILTGQLLGEVAGGDAEYRRAAATLSASHPLPFGLAGAVEVGGGALWGDVLLQRTYFLGGAATLRGFDDGDARGPAFWRARSELATGFAGARLALFGDAGWAGPRDAVTFDDPFVSVGVGASLLDGLFRMDLSRAVRRGSSFKVDFYLDGLF